MPKELPSPELLRKLLRYEPDTGKLFWLERSPDMFDGSASRSAEWRCRNWNSRHCGNEAMPTVDANGYKRGAIGGVQLLAHRVCWAIHHGEWPNQEIDHINGCKSDNSISNLRDVSRSENGKNLPRRHDNISGRTGVSFIKTEGLWVAQIVVSGKLIKIGRFPSFERAAKARDDAEINYGFHRNHGRMAK